ncbi:MAG: ATP-binding protein [Betaproteobacteria bacterium]|nr:ATP-binding protein [Betaproteobacteria bacterium]
MLQTALDESRIVAIVGPRQSGKTTLARVISEGTSRSFVSLDDRHQRQFAADDQVGFMREQRFAVIDEIQHVPDLVLALKRSVDEDQRPGRYLITGSVDFFNSALAPDSLAGRLATVELLPFSQAEIGRQPAAGFLHRAFAADFPDSDQIGFDQDINSRVLAGGYPAALAAKNASAASRWLRNYAQTIVRRDVAALGNPRNADSLADLLAQAAAAAGGLISLSSLAKRLMAGHNSVERWLVLLERMFMLQRVRAWHRNRGKRLIKAPKLHFIDSGMLAALRRVNAKTLGANRHELGPLLESFVFSELRKAMALAEDYVQLSHYRHRGGSEVDFVVEDFAGRTVGIEVKAASSVAPADFRGLRCLAEDVGSGFACGIVLHDGDRISRVGERLFAMPVKMLWDG